VGDVDEKARDDAAFRAREAWPEIAVSDADFAAYLAERSAGDTARIADLYLACACARRDPRALALFDEHVLGEVPRYIAHVDGSKAFADEVRQALRERLFLGDAPKILEYTGRGPIGGWIRVAAIRIALNMRRDSARKLSREAADAPRPSSSDLELQMLRARYASEVEQAIEETLRGLTRDERNVLRMHYLDGVGTDAIGKAYGGVHRSTVLRWIEAAREKILAETRRLLAARLGLGASDLESLVGLVKSQLDTSIVRVLRG
jgi:RNA polymerase sigma-70 factor (ECF subfamily)